MRQAHLTGALQQNLEKDLDLTMWDEENMDEYERIYLQKHCEPLGAPSQESAACEADKDRPSEPPEASTVQLQLSGEQNREGNRITGQDDMFQGMFESTEKLPETPAARMSAAFDELETMLDEAVHRRLSLPAVSLPNISSTPMVTPTELHLKRTELRPDSTRSHRR